MQLVVLQSALPDPDRSIRRLGYALHMDRRTHEKSFVRRLDRDLFPRFHLYVEEKGDNYSLNLHLDQRAPVYAGVTAHSGDYDGVVVEGEMERIEKQLQLSS
ncbi:MAG: hypothetical protein EXS55_00765 [Candidatus Magasanikbacteria bacterium]|nr:hypothetical protein [Candidatus Magasanikbacteria bacterium]